MKIRETHRKQKIEYHEKNVLRGSNFVFLSSSSDFAQRMSVTNYPWWTCFFAIVCHTKWSSYETKSTQRWYVSQLKKNQDQHLRSQDLQNLHLLSCGNAPECDNRLNMYRFNMVCLHASSISSFSERQLSLTSAVSLSKTAVTLQSVDLYSTTIALTPSKLCVLPLVDDSRTRSRS